VNIGDLFLSLLADGSRLEKDVVQEADKAGKAGGRTLGQRLKAGLSAQGIGTALGAAFGGVAAAGLKMGDSVDAAYDSIRIGTGKTGEELAALQGDFREAAARVPDDIGVVGQAIADLNTRTGQTGEGLQDLAVSILDFSRLTKSDVNTNVRNATRLFGDWSIKTEDQAATLDKVFRASQETGIGVDALMQKVVDFGSPLRLLGFQFEESVALLSKWEKEGVNTETALTGLKFSVKTLAREGVPAADMAATLQGRIAAIGESADPVNEAIKLFGLRAGPDLAAAILEGRFATEDLLEVINNGTDTIATATADTQDFGESWRKFANRVQTTFGGLFTGFAGVAETMGPLLYAFPALGGAMGNLAARALTSSGKIATAFAGLAGKITGPLSRALASSGVVDAISGGLSTAIGKVPGSSKFAKASAGLGKFLGSKLGKGLSIAFAAVAVVEVIETYNRIKGELEAQTEEIGSSLADQFKSGTEAELRTSKAALEQGLKDLNGVWDAGIFTTDTRKGLEAQLAAVETELARRAAGIPPAVAAPLAAGEGAVTDATEDMLEGAEDELYGLAEEAGEIGRMTPQELADGIRESRSKPVDAMEQLTEMLKEPMSVTAEVSRLMGQLASENLVKGLQSNDPAIRAQAAATKAVILGRLRELKVSTGVLSAEAAANLEKGLKSKDPQIRAAAEAIKAMIANPVSSVSSSAYGWGQKFGTQYAMGMQSRLALVKTVSQELANNVRNYLQVRSPAKAGPFHELGGPEGWGRRWGVLYQRGLGAGLTGVDRMIAGAQPAPAAPRSPGLVGPSLAAATGSAAAPVAAAAPAPVQARQGDINIPVTVQGLVKARDPLELARQMRRHAEIGMIAARRGVPR